ncbi:MAG: cell wall-binding repeat-containing protein [Actinomycetes bacterium]
MPTGSRRRFALIGGVVALVVAGLVSSALLGSRGASVSYAQVGYGYGYAPPPSPPVATIARLAGADRIQTAIQVSQSQFPTAGSAKAVVLARADIYPDAMVGGPLAAHVGGPLLLTESAGLDAATQAEIQRVLPAGGTVYLLGGTGALSPAVATSLTGLGFHVTRYWGSTRFGTAIAVADALGNPTTIFEATGLNYPDALSAGPAAVAKGGAILLTDGSVQSSDTAAYLSAHPGVTRYAVGGPAASADRSATPLVGADRFATSVAVANQFFTSPGTVGVATGMNFPDALSATPDLGTIDAPILLVDPTTPLPASVAAYLSTRSSTITTVSIFGGTGAVSSGVSVAISTALGG